MWSIDAAGRVLSKRGNTIIHKESNELESLFHEEYSEDFLKSHYKTLKGENAAFFSSVNSGAYYTRLISHKDMSGEITGLTGVSWDITSNFSIMKSLEQIINIASSKDSDPSEIIKVAKSALESSRIKKLLEEAN